MERCANENSPLLPLWRDNNTERSGLQCFKTKCCIRSRPALLILLWNFIVLLAYKELYNINVAVQVRVSYVSYIYIPIAFSFFAVLAPVAGLLMDIKFSRYKTTLCASFSILAHTPVSYTHLTLPTKA